MRVLLTASQPPAMIGEDGRTRGSGGAVATTFDSTKESLQDLLKQVGAGTVQLPDFQRGWVWDDDHLRSLLASISTSFPIGAVMTLEAGNPHVRFQPRTVEGVRLQTPREPERLILDGQQRLTSLYQALMLDEPVLTRDSRGKEIRRWYYVDLNRALDPNGDREEAIVGVPPERVVKTDFGRQVLIDVSTPELEWEEGFLPVRLLFDVSGLFHWQYGYVSGSEERRTHWPRVMDEVIQPFLSYQVPVIQLRKDTTKEAVCRVFEKVNTGGVPLSVFELLTATFAAEGFRLRNDWEKRDQDLRSHPVLNSKVDISNDFLQAVTLLATYGRKKRVPAAGVSAKRKDVLLLNRQDYEELAEPVTRGYERAARLLFAEKIFSADDVPYRTQLVPLAAVMAELGDRAAHDGIKAKLRQWLWCGILGELYGSATETRFAKDLPQLVEWVEGGSEPDTVVDANFLPVRLRRLQSRQSAAYKGVHALVMQHGAQDFRTGDVIDHQRYFDDRIEIHHIFPFDWCKKNGIPKELADSIVNKTAISAGTNRTISSLAPSRYLAKLEHQARIAPARMDEILSSHLIDPDALRSDDFHRFFTRRQEALLDLIENAMGKPLQQAPPVGEEEADAGAGPVEGGGAVWAPADTRGVVVVEGTTDEEYLRLADEVAGDGRLSGIHIVSAGGVDRAVRQALSFKDGSDLPILVIFDKDENGKRGHRLLAERFSFQNRREVMTYADLLGKGIDNVEAEDLFPEGILQTFITEYGEDNVLSEKTRHKQLDRWHYGFNAAGKDYLPEFLRAHATATDLSRWVELLDLIRTRLGLAPAPAGPPPHVPAEPASGDAGPALVMDNAVASDAPTATAASEDVHIQEVLDMCDSLHAQGLLERFLTEVRSWPEVRAWAGSGENLQWRNVHFSRKGSRFGAFCRMHPRLERLRFRLDGDEVLDLQFAQTLERKDPYRVLVVLRSEGALQEALRLARRAYDDAV